MTEFSLPNVSHDLSSNIALVTGATSGLGWNFARVLAKAGAKVAIAGRRTENLDKLQAVIQQDGGQAFPYPLDVSDSQACENTVAKISDELGLVDILVNNAGVVDAQRVVNMSNQLIDQVININLKAPLILSREVAARLIAVKKPGRIVNISSIAAFRYDGNGAALYSTTKSAVARLTETLAVEWARFHINVNGIAPGAFESEMMDGMLARMGDIASTFPRKRLGKPAQLDSSLLYLCSPASECVTGTILKVDDGQSSR